jgi:diguanylate cyclase
MKTILVIEDDPAIRNNISMILKSQGFTILQAEDGLTGIELALGAAPDLIVCDIMLPEISGYEILERLRQVPDSAITPFIFLTALADRSDMRQGMNLGADDYLTKPFTSQELIGAVNARLTKQQELTVPYRNEMQKAVENLRQMAYTDLLTNLPNRVLFWQKIEEYLANPDKSPCALLLIQLRNLNDITDQEGQSVADLLIQSLARSLQDLIHDGDILARCNPDSFGLLLTQQAESEQSIESYISPLLTEWIPAYPLGKQFINCDLKIAVAPYPLAGQSTPELITSAEKVLNSFENQAVESYKFYTEAFKLNSTQSDRILEVLQSSVNTEAELDNQFNICYQPILNTITGRIICLEAILQWNNAEFQTLDHEYLWTTIERSKQVNEINQWKLKTILEEFKRLQSYSLNPLKVAFNLSNRFVQKTDFLQTLQTTFESVSLDLSLLILEIQEMDLLQSIDSYGELLDHLNHQGIQIAISHFGTGYQLKAKTPIRSRSQPARVSADLPVHFISPYVGSLGTGYSSIPHLSQLPLHYLKVSPEIIHTALQNPQSESILKAIVTLAQSLKLKVIAEGVEIDEQLNLLRKQGCPLMQGNVYSPPVSFAEVQSLLESDRRLG